MIQFAYLDAEGYPSGGGSKPYLPEGAVELPEGIIAGPDLARLFLAEGVWVWRPDLPRPIRTESGFELDGLPANATVIIVDIDTGLATICPQHFVGVVSVKLNDLTTYTVHVSAPRPWVPSETMIEMGGGSQVRAEAALDAQRQVAIATVNAAVGRARLPYLTDIAGQQAIYAEKVDEARAYVALASPPLTLADFPMLAAEIGITAPDAGQLAQVWLNMVALLRAVGAQSEQMRLGAINLINAAESQGEIDAILEEFPLK